MSKVFIHATMTLDGFIARPNDDIDWAFRYGSDAMAEGTLQAVGAVVLGNRGFREGTVTIDRLPYGGLPVPQYVVTHTPRQPLSLKNLTFTFVTAGIEHAVEMAKKAAGEKDVALLGASIGQQALRDGLVDEIIIHLCPLLLGRGIRLFDQLGGKSIELKRIEVVTTAGVTSLRFKVVK